MTQWTINTQHELANTERQVGTGQTLQEMAPDDGDFISDQTEVPMFWGIHTNKSQHLPSTSVSERDTLPS